MINDQTLEEFLERLASREPTPGGGSAAGLMGAMGAALLSMVCHLTIGKPQYAEAEEALVAVLEEAEPLRARLLAGIAQDVEAFEGVMAAYGLPKDSEDAKEVRAGAIQHALRGATEAPLECARLSRKVIALSSTVAGLGSRQVISDAGVAVMAAYAALKSAGLNVFINAPALKDRAYAEAALAELDALSAGLEDTVAAVYQRVRERL